MSVAMGLVARSNRGVKGRSTLWIVLGMMALGAIFFSIGCLQRDSSFASRPDHAEADACGFAYAGLPRGREPVRLLANQGFLVG